MDAAGLFYVDDHHWRVRQEWDVYKTPIVATRVGDVPSAVILADPALFHS